MLMPRALLAPHLTTLVLDEHRRHDTPMLSAMRREAERLWSQGPQAVVVVSAHDDTRGPFQVGAGRAHRSLTADPAFGVEVRYDCPGHPRLARALVEAGERARLRVGATPRGIDGNVTVPLHFLLPARNVPVVPVQVSDRSESECRAFGAVIRQVLTAWPERVGVVVGGMLSHATHQWHYRREVPEAAVLDQHVLAALAEGRWPDLLEVDPRVLERAQPEAGLRHLALLRGILGADVRGEVLSYESVPGMGSALVAFDVPGGVEIPAEPMPAAVVAIPVERRPPVRRRAHPRSERPASGSRPRAGSGPRPRAGSGPRPRAGSGSRPRAVSGSRPRVDRGGRPARPDGTGVRSRVASRAGAPRDRARPGEDGRLPRARVAGGRRGPGRNGARASDARSRISAGSRTPRGRRPARASRPGRKRPG